MYLSKIIITSLLFVNVSLGQVINDTITKIYETQSDSVYFKWSNYPELFSAPLVAGEIISPGTNTAKDIILTAYIGKDSLQIKGDNYPYAKSTTVMVKTSDGIAQVIFRYNSVSASFTQDYIEKNKNNIQFSIPEVYELSNIILALSATEKEKTNYRSSMYYRRISKYFEKNKNHPLVKKVKVLIKANDNNFLSFRENSFLYQFRNDSLTKGKTYHYVFGEDWQGFTNLFTDMLDLVQDFSLKSKYREFYKSNKQFYENELERFETNIPVRDMWVWLDREFPNQKQNSYKIIFSPLITHTHSTQNYQKLLNYETGERFKESVFFVPLMTIYDDKLELTEKQKIALISGAVFTEIDHNYVNPTTRKFAERINSIFGNKEVWTSEENTFYRKEVLVFNEYMTHALFCIWAEENFDRPLAHYAIKERVRLNQKLRGFVKFKEFKDELFRLRKLHKGKLCISELYPMILDWCSKQN